MVTRDILHLTIDSFHYAVVKKNFQLLSVGWRLFRVVSCNRYVPRSSNENALYFTSTGNVFVTFGNHTTSGFSHDSLNSGKFI